MRGDVTESRKPQRDSRSGNQTLERRDESLGIVQFFRVGVVAVLPTPRSKHHGAGVMTKMLATAVHNMHRGMCTTMPGGVD